MSRSIIVLVALWLLVIGDADAFKRRQLGIKSEHASTPSISPYSSTDASQGQVAPPRIPATSAQALSISRKTHTTKQHASGFLTERRDSLRKRAPRPEKSFDQCLTTGKNVIDAINCQSSPPQKFNDFSDFAANGYMTTKEEMNPGRLFEGVGILGDDLKIPKDGWMKWSISHYELKSASAGGVQFDIATHAGSGVIFVLNAYGALSPQTEGGPPLTILFQLSDIAYLCLAEHAKLKGLPIKFNYYAMKEVVNASSRNRCLDILKASTRQQMMAAENPWPGYTLKVEGVQGQMGEGTMARALLGTPTGLAPGYILATHQPTFPKRTISFIAIQKAYVGAAKDPKDLKIVEMFQILVTIGDLP